MIEYWPVIPWIFGIALGVMLGLNKGQEFHGFFWPCLLGPFGLLVVLCLRDKRKELARLDEKIHQQTVIALLEQQNELLRDLRRDQ